MAIAYIEEKAGATKRPNGKYLQRQELRLARKVKARFNSQMKWALSAIKGLSYFQEAKGVTRLLTKTIRSDVNDLLDDMPDVRSLTADITATASDTYRKGAREIISKIKPPTGTVSFNLVNTRAKDYIDALETLQLSDFKGSISVETKGRLQKLLADAIETGQSYQETAAKIKAQGEAGVFSRARAELIAVNQVGRAYGTGTDETVRDYAEKAGTILQKAWQTVEDTQVTEECQANQSQGWIGIQQGFSSGDEYAPRSSNPRCRCATLYKQVDASGNDI